MLLGVWFMVTFTLPIACSLRPTRPTRWIRRGAGNSSMVSLSITALTTRCIIVSTYSYYLVFQFLYIMIIYIYIYTYHIPYTLYIIRYTLYIIHYILYTYIYIHIHIHIHIRTPVKSNVAQEKKNQDINIAPVHRRLLGKSYILDDAESCQHPIQLSLTWHLGRPFQTRSIKHEQSKNPDFTLTWPKKKQTVSVSAMFHVKVPRLFFFPYSPFRAWCLKRQPALKPSFLVPL